MKYLPLIWMNLWRSKTRLLLTLGSFAVALFLFGILMSLNNAFYQGLEIAQADRLVTRNKTSLIMMLPQSHGAKIRRIKGVGPVTSAMWFGGVYQDPKNFFPQMGIEPEEYFEVYSDYTVNEREWKNFLKDRQGCVAGKALVERFGWKIGDRIPIQGTIFPGTWEFNLSAIYDGKKPSLDTTALFFHRKYIEENVSWLKGKTGWYTLRVTDPDQALEICRQIDGQFENSSSETRSEPESLFAAGFIKQFGNIKLILFGVGAVVFFTLLLVNGSTMAMAVRERTNEIGVMKTLGFSGGAVLCIVLGESILYALLGGGMGLTLAKLYTLQGDPTKGMLPFFFLKHTDIALGLLITLTVGIVSGLLPAVNAMRLTIIQAIRRT
jgi:putative ABC transport system permease protein